MDELSPSDLKTILHSKRANLYYLQHSLPGTGQRRPGRVPHRRRPAFAVLEHPDRQHHHAAARYRHLDHPGGDARAGQGRWLKLIPHRVEESLERSGQSPYVPACDLLQPIEPASAPGIAVWGRFDLAELLADQARALDRPLAAIAPA